MNHRIPLYGAIEAGGTKFICAVGDRDGHIKDRVRIGTRDPATTLGEVCRYFASAARQHGELAALGVGAFGPLDLQPASATFGYITDTPKAGWQQTDLVGSLVRGVGRPIFLDTDVNAAALGELRWGSGRNCDSLAYVTVGTGIGVGVVHHGRPVHGLMHPELGHIRVRRHPDDAGFPGICPFHRDCLEGLASGPAIIARTGRTLADVPGTDRIWSIESDYLGQLCALLVLAHSPQRILLGGGVMREPMYAAIHTAMLDTLQGYLRLERLHSPDYLAPPGLGDEAGIKGALTLAIAAG